MIRRVRKLTDADVREIFLADLAGESRLSIARRFEVDHSTIHYHIKRVIAVIAPKACGHGHASFKCLVCGETFDNIKSNELIEISRLRGRVRELEERLGIPYGAPPGPSARNPIVSIDC